MKRQETINSYRNVIEGHVAKAPLGSMPIQQVTADDIEGYYLALKLASSSINIHHAVLSQAFRIARKKKLISVNPMIDVERADRDDGRRTIRRFSTPARRCCSDRSTAAMHAPILRSGSIRPSRRRDGDSDSRRQGLRRFCAPAGQGYGAVTPQIRELAEKVWHYHQLGHTLSKADAIM